MVAPTIVDVLRANNLTRLQILWAIYHDNSFHADECYELADCDYHTTMRYVTTRCAIAASMFRYLLTDSDNNGWVRVTEPQGHQCVSVRIMPEVYAPKQVYEHDHELVLLEIDGSKYTLDAWVNKYQPRIVEGWNYTVPDGYITEMWAAPLVPGLTDRISTLLTMNTSQLSDEYAELLL